ncbi:MAG: molybdopterin molybdenumtransferase MoeA [Candidatus Nanopelagicales bacterium]
MSDTLVSWSIARRAAREAADSLPVVSVPLAAAVGAVLAEPLIAATALPPADAARVDGWAVSGPGPWTVVAGPLDHLSDGCAVEVPVGGVLPFGADSVLRADHAVLDDRLLHVGDPASGRLAPHSGYVEPGSDVRPRGEEAAAGETLLQAGGVVTPSVAALAAAAGLDQLPVVRPPDVAIVVPERGRDVLGPMLPGWVAWAGGRAFPPVRVLGGLPELVDVVDDANSDVIVVTGATSTSDDVHRAVAQLGGRWVVDGVAVRPGTASSLAVLPDGRRVVSLPDAPLGAIAGVLTLLVPLVAVLRGELGADESRTEEAVLADDVPPGLPDVEGFVRLVPVIRRRTSLVPSAAPLPHDGPGALRGLALADGLAVVPYGGGARGTGVQVLPLP